MTAAAAATDFRALAASGTLAMNAQAHTGAIGDGFADGYVAEPKFDGARLLVGVQDGAVHVFSRAGNAHDGKLAVIEAELAELPDGTWLDCELVGLTVVGEKVVNDWGAAQSIMSSGAVTAAQADRVTLLVFDLLAYDGHDARSLAYAQRRGFLEQVFEKHDFERVALTPQLEATHEAYLAAVAQGFEGVMLKRIDAPYRAGRGGAWLKVKASHTIDAVIMDFEPGKGSFADLIGAIVFGQVVNGVLVEMGTASGFDMALREAMSEDPADYLGRVVEIRHNGVLKSGRYRHPVYVRMRDDKTAAECEREDVR